MKTEIPKGPPLTELHQVRVWHVFEIRGRQYLALPREVSDALLIHRGLDEGLRGQFLYALNLHNEDIERFTPECQVIAHGPVKLVLDNDE